MISEDDYFTIRLISENFEIIPRTKTNVVLSLLLTLKVFSILISGLEAATGGVLLKKVFLKISQNLHENTCTTVSFFDKEPLLKKRLYHRCFLWILRNF